MGHMIKQTKTIISAVTLVLLTGLAGISGSVIAMTPDGQTPANEGICDPLQGGTGGLYGLCVAYCEAQDLDSVDKEPPRTKILDNYRKKMQAGDPDMPCVNTGCPCWSDAELASVVKAACSTGTSTLLLIGVAPERQEAFADTNRNRCSYVDLNVVPDTVNTQSVTPAEAQVCFNELDAICNP